MRRIAAERLATRLVAIVPGPAGSVWPSVGDQPGRLRLHDDARHVMGHDVVHFRGDRHALFVADEVAVRC